VRPPSRKLHAGSGRERNSESDEDRAGAIERNVFGQKRVDDRTNRPSDKLLCHIVDVSEND